MTLTIEQLEDLISMASIAHNGFLQLSDIDSAKRRLAVLRAADVELHRLTHGPFTLVEAIASGRPFRRKGRDYWFRFESEQIKRQGLKLQKSAGNSWMPTSHFGTGMLHSLVTPEDLTATDYEIMPEGGE